MILNSHTAIYAQNGTIDVGRFVGCEVEIGGGDLLGTTQATYGNFGRMPSSTFSGILQPFRFR